MIVKSVTRNSIVIGALMVPSLGCDSGSSELEPLDAGAQSEGLLDMEQMQADGLHMRQLFQDRDVSRALPIDVGNDQQYRFMVDRLRATGFSPLMSPELFDRIDSARFAAVNNLVPRTTTDRCDMFITTGGGEEGTLATLGRSSCISGSDYTMVQVCHYDGLGVLLDCSYHEEFGGGISADVETLTEIDEGYADGVAYHLTDSGEEFYYFWTPSTSTSGNLSMDMVHPEDLNGSGDVLVCLERSLGSGDCDYKHSNSGACAGNALCDNADDPIFPVFNPEEVGNDQGLYQGSRLYLPLQFSAPGLIPNATAINSAQAWLTLVGAGDTTPAGGLCTADFSNSPHISLEPFGGWKKLFIDPFALNVGNALWPSHCIDHRAAAELHVEVNVQTGASSRVYAWDSSMDYGAIAIAWGCLPPGTMITLADGAQVSIERVEPGDRVQTDDDGGVLTVVDVMEGYEDEPLVVVEDSLGHEVTMTVTHPIPTLDRGVVTARELQPGDRIETEDGVGYVEVVTFEDYEGEVYNLVLGTPDELEGLGDDTTMIANHVVVGDARMQGLLREERSAASEEKRAQAELPPALYVDYVGAQFRSLVRQLAE